MTADLIARLEAAEVGSREMDRAIVRALGFVEVSDPRDAIECWRGQDGMAHYATHNVTTSLDAALAMAERVLGEDQALEILADEARAALEDTINGSLKRVPIDVCINAILRIKQGEG